MNDHPCPGTCCFPITSVPPAFLNVSMAESISSTPMKFLALSVGPILLYIPPPTLLPLGPVEISQ